MKSRRENTGTFRLSRGNGGLRKLAVQDPLLDGCLLRGGHTRGVADVQGGIARASASWGHAAVQNAHERARALGLAYTVI
jgi:hypothetical protein